MPGSSMYSVMDYHQSCVELITGYVDSLACEKDLAQWANHRNLINWWLVLIFLQVEFAPPVGYVEPEWQEKKEEKKEEEVINQWPFSH